MYIWSEMVYLTIFIITSHPIIWQAKPYPIYPSFFPTCFQNMLSLGIHIPPEKIAGAKNHTQNTKPQEKKNWCLGLGFHQKRHQFFRRVLAPTWLKLLSSCFSFWSLRSSQLAMSWSVSFVWRMVDGATRTQIDMLRLENKVVCKDICSNLALSIPNTWFVTCSFVSTKTKGFNQLTLRYPWHTDLQNWRFHLGESRMNCSLGIVKARFNKVGPEPIAINGVISPL